MNTSSSTIVLNSLLNQLPGERKHALASVLSPELQQALSASSFVSLEQLQQIHPLEEEMDAVHYSWLAPFLRTLPEREIKLFLAALSKAQANCLKEALLLSNSVPTLSSLGKGFLQKTLAEQLMPQDLLPRALLPEDPLNELLDLSSDQLFHLIDLLAMHDLSVEIKQVIDKTRLSEIHALLSKEQKTFLQTLMQKKEQLVFKRLGLVSWDKDHEVLYSLLVQRGINRLAKALYPSHRSLLWYLAHRLDVEKGKMLIKLSVALSHEKAYELLVAQVIELKNQITI